MNDMCNIGESVNGGSYARLTVTFGSRAIAAHSAALGSIKYRFAFWA